MPKGTPHKGKSYISHPGCPDLANQAEQLMTEQFLNLTKPVRVSASALP